jgi:hypothetical protein
MTAPESLSRRILDILDALVLRCPGLSACCASLEVAVASAWDAFLAAIACMCSNGEMTGLV